MHGKSVTGCFLPHSPPPPKCLQTPAPKLVGLQLQMTDNTQNHQSHILKKCHADKSRRLFSSNRVPFLQFLPTSLFLQIFEESAIVTELPSK